MIIIVINRLLIIFLFEEPKSCLNSSKNAAACQLFIDMTSFYTFDYV